MTLAKSFVEYLEDLNFGIFEQDIFIGLAPSSNKVPDAIFWVVASGGNTTQKMASGEVMKEYILNVYYRDINYENVYSTLEDLEQQISCTGCLELEGVDLISISANNLMIDEDLDSEYRKVGLLQITLMVYADCIINVS